MPLRVESRLWTLGVISCDIIRTLPSPNAIAKPPASGPPKIVGADTFFASGLAAEAGVAAGIAGQKLRKACRRTRKPEA